MPYDLTDADIDNLSRRFSPGAVATPRQRGIVRDWFATLPVVAAADVERALGPMTADEYRKFNDAYFGQGGGGFAAFDAVFARRLAKLGGFAEPSPTTRATVRDGGFAETEARGVEDAGEFRRPVSSAPDPLAEPTEKEIQRAIERWFAYADGERASVRHVLIMFVADRREQAPPSASEPISPAAEAAAAPLAIVACIQSKEGDAS